MKFNRRHFLATLFVGGGASYFYFKGQKVRPYRSEVQVMLALAHHLYPTSTLGFGVDQINLASYLLFVLQDERILQDDRDYLLRGIAWVEEDAFKQYQQSFMKLNHEQKEALLQAITLLQWGDNYINYLFSYIFEAMFAAPVYGSHSDKLAWKWSGHNPGFPQPQNLEDIDYA
jgi:hypothetical protein